MRFLIRIGVVFFLIGIPEALRADPSLFERLLFSNQSYARHLEVKVYILTEKQSADLLVNPTQEPIQLLSCELARFSKLYLLVRVKNHGSSNAWGTLGCLVPRVWCPIEVPVISIQRDFCNYFISLEGSSMVNIQEKFMPKITFFWEELYTK